MPFARDVVLALSHQIFLDIVKAGGEGFEVDNAFEFDYAGSVKEGGMRTKDIAYYQVSRCSRLICIYLLLANIATKEI